MVLPLADDNSERVSPPVVNLLLIGINVLVFCAFQWVGTNDDFTYALTLVPGEIVTGHSNGQTISPVYLTLLTSMFLHGGWMHLLGNMWFLYIFGDNVEDRLGHVRYLAYYLVCGVLASLAHVGTTYMFGQDPNVPSLGASGAISGVLGGYLILFPTNRVTMLLGRFITQAPAFVAIGLWFVFQIISSLGALGEGARAGGVAYGAHIGGFVVGLVLIKVIEPRRNTNEPRTQ